MWFLCVQLKDGSFLISCSECEHIKYTNPCSLGIMIVSCVADPSHQLSSSQKIWWNIASDIMKYLMGCLYCVRSCISKHYTIFINVTYFIFSFGQFYIDSLLQQNENKFKNQHSETENTSWFLYIEVWSRMLKSHFILWTVLKLPKFERQILE